MWGREGVLEFINHLLYVSHKVRYLLYVTKINIWQLLDVGVIRPILLMR